MDIQALRSQYEIAKNTDDYGVHANFIKTLLASNGPDAIDYHYNLLRDRDNRDLYLRLRAAFVKRGEAGARYLVERIGDEKNPSVRADVLHLLGRLRHPSALPLARQALSSDDADLRHRGCYVLGWMGEEEDIERLGKCLLTDRDPYVRRTAATAHSQFNDHLPSAKDRLLRNLKQALQTEKDDQVAGWIIVTIQYILGKRFGMKEDIEEGELKGDVAKAREKCLRTLEKLP